MYDEPVDPKQDKHVLTKRAQLLCSGTWNTIRAKCKKELGSVIPTDSSKCCPDNIDQEDWEDILKSWMKPEWKKRLKVGAENKKNVPGVEAGTSSYVRHTGGSINFGIHRKKMVCTCYFFMVDGVCMFYMLSTNICMGHFLKSDP